MKKKGSALLMVITLMSIFLLYLTTVWYTTSYTYQLMLASKNYQSQRLQATSLMLWTIALCKENFDTLKTYARYESKTITLKKWPPYSKKNSYGKVTFSVLDDALALKVTHEGKTIVCNIHRLQEDDKEPKFEVEKWQESST